MKFGFGFMHFFGEQKNNIYVCRCVTVDPQTTFNS